MGYQEFNSARHTTPYCALWVERTEQDTEIVRRMTRLVVRHQVEKAMTATLVFRDETLDLIDLDIFTKDTEWSILLGHRTDFLPFGPFSLADYTMAFGQDGVATITVNLMDATRRLAKAAKYRSFENLSAGDVVRMIAEEHGMGFTIEDSESVLFDENLPLMQAGQTDAALLRQLATRFGYRFQIRDGAIVFKQTQVNTDVTSGKVLAWRVGSRNLKSFAPAQKTFGGKGGKGGGGAAAQPGANIIGGNVDIETGAAFAYDFLANGTQDGLLQQLSGGAEEAAETEVPPSDDAAATEEARQRTFDTETGTWRLVAGGDTPTVSHKDTDGDTPQTAGEAAAAAAAAKAGARSDIALGVAVLTLPDMAVQQGDWVEVIGCGLRFSGRWRIAEWEHTLAAEGLTTTLKLAKKGLGASSATQGAEDATGNSSRPEEPQDERTGRTFNYDTGTWDPPKDTTPNASPLDVSFNP